MSIPSPSPAEKPTTDVDAASASTTAPSYDGHHDAPPPYTFPQVWGSSSLSDNKSAMNQQAPQLQAGSSSSSNPQSRRQGSRFLHIYRPDMFSRDLTVIDDDKTTVAYTATINHGTIFSEKPHMKVFRCPIEAQAYTKPVGTATFHHYGRSVDLELYGRPASMDSEGIFSLSHVFMSGIGPLSWKSNSWNGDLILTTAGKEWLAKFEGNRLSMDKRGKLEIVSWDIEDEGLDEIVVSGLAMVEYFRRRRNR